jgi:hypothetical protein
LIFYNGNNSGTYQNRKVNIIFVTLLIKTFHSNWKSKITNGIVLTTLKLIQKLRLMIAMCMYYVSIYMCKVKERKKKEV